MHYICLNLRKSKKSVVETNIQNLNFWQGKWPLRLVLGFLAILFLINRSPFVGFNDGMSFLYSAETGFDLDTNATSHFLYNNLLHILVKLFFFVPPVLLLTLFSILCSILALSQFARIASIFSKSSFAIASLTLILGMAFTFWQQTEVIEVYAFNNLIFLTFVRIGLVDLIENQNRKNAIWLSLILGIGLLTHIQHILSIPFFLIYIWTAKEFSNGKKLAIMLPWMALMSILFILPQVLKTHSLGAVFVESQFKQDLFGMELKVLLKGIGLGIGMLVYNFGLSLVFVFLGWLKMIKERRNVAYWLLALLLPYAGFAFKYSVNDNHVFFLCAYFVLLLPAVLILERIRLPFKRWFYLGSFALIPILMYFTAVNLAPKVGVLAAYDRAKAYKGGVQHLLWPGKSRAKDPLALAKSLKDDNSEEAAQLRAEWNYETAIRYLEWKEN